MNQLSGTLKEVDRIEIVTIIDNYVDVLLEDTDVVTRPPHAKGGEILTDALLAEHGLSLLATVEPPVHPRPGTAPETLRRSLAC